MDTSDTPYGFLTVAFAVALYSFILYGFRRVHVGLTDIFSLNSLYIAFGSAGLFGYYIGSGKAISATLLALLALWLCGMWLGVTAGLPAPQREHRSRLNPRTKSFDVAGLAVVSVVYLVYVYSILNEGLLFGGGIDLTNRFLLVQENKVQAYFLGAVTFVPAVLLFRINPRLEVFKAALVLMPFGLVQAATLSKTGMISLLVSVLIYYGLQVRFNYRPRPSMRRQVAIISMLVALVLIIFWTILKFLTSFEEPLVEFVVTRLMRSFDSLIYLSDTTIPQDQEMSLLQWYLAPFLKVLNLFSQYYNGFNYVIAIEYFGFTGESTPLLPNNTQVGELYVAYPLIFAAMLSLLFGLAYGFLYSRAWIYIARGGPLVLSAAFVVASPFGFLVDGQGYFIALLCSLIMCGMGWIVQTLRLFSRGTRRVKVGAGS